MPAEDIYSWSVTSALNGTSDPGISWPEGQTRESVNNSARAMMAAHAKDRDWQTGASAVGGAVNALTFYSGNNYITVPVGFTVRLKIPADKLNTGAATLNMDNIGAVAILSNSALALTGGELVGYCDFRWDGTNWILLHSSNIISAFIRIITQTFVASGTYTPTSGMQFCTIECVGGGGGGGGSTGGGLTTYFSGGGGGSGGYSRKTVSSDSIGTSQAVTIGVGGSAGAFSTFSGGGSGGSSSVGTLCLANGGIGGSPAGDPWGLGQGGPGGSAGTGDFAAAGAPGDHGEFRQAPATPGAGFSGGGGSSYFGGGGVSVPSASNSTNGTDGSNYGSGASGGSTSNALTGAMGGTGSAGVVIITEFCA